MTEPARNPVPTDPAADAHARREGIRRRLAEEGFTLHVPARGAEWHPAEPFPVSAEELSEMVVRLRRGGL